MGKVSHEREGTKRLQRQIKKQAKEAKRRKPPKAREDTRRGK
jgi:hypothetical protein